MHKKLNFLIAILLITLFSALLIYSFTSRNVMTWFYAKTSYYFLFTLCSLWLWQFIRFLKHLNLSLNDFIKSYWPGICLSLVLTAIVFTTIPVQFKILGDETNLLSVSQSMYYNKDARIISMAEYYHGDLHVVDVSIPNRPLLFSFVTSIIHSVLSYHHQNVFILNFLIMFMFLTGIYVAARKSTDTQSGIAAIFLVLSYPVFTIYGTSGGYDLFSTFFFAIIMAVFYLFLKSPNAENLAFLWINLLMFSNIRYESCIFFLIVIIAALRFIKLSYLKTHPYIYALTPLLSLPYIWQRILSQGTYENPLDAPLFSIQSFLKYGQIFIQNFLNLHLDLPYAGVLNITAVAVVCYLLSLIVTKKIVLKSYQKYFGCILLLCIAVMLVIVLSHHFGDYERPTQARLFMYFSVFCALTPIFLKALVPNWISGKKLMFASLLVFLFYQPIAGEHAFINRQVITRIHQHTQEFLKQTNDRNALLISAYSGHYVPLSYGAVTIRYANRHYDLIIDKFKRHRYSKIFVLQEISYTTNTPLWENQKLDPRFKLQTVREIQFFDDRYLRISSVKI
jgi:hypothetical protein